MMSLFFFIGVSFFTILRLLFVLQNMVSAKIEPCTNDEQHIIFIILENTTSNKYQPKPNGNRIPQNTLIQEIC